MSYHEIAGENDREDIEKLTRVLENQFEFMSETVKLYFFYSANGGG